MNETFIIVCPHCQQKRSIPCKYQGRNVRCVCGKTFLAVASSGASTRVANPNPALQTVETFQIKKGLLGKFGVSYQCPHCDATLHSSESELNSQEICPDCNGTFLISNQARRTIDGMKAQERLAKEKIAEEKTAAKLLQQQARAEAKAAKARQQEFKRQQELKRQQEMDRPYVATQASDAMAVHAVPLPPVDVLGVRCWYCQNFHNRKRQCPYCRMIRR